MIVQGDLFVLAEHYVFQSAKKVVIKCNWNVNIYNNKLNQELSIIPWFSKKIKESKSSSKVKYIMNCPQKNYLLTDAKLLNNERLFLSIWKIWTKNSLKKNFPEKGFNLK